MVITGSRSRNLYPQDTVNWLMNLQPGSSGVFNFYFQTDKNQIPIFSLKNGKVLSPNGDMVDGYVPNTTLSFSGNVTDGRADLYNNNLPLYLGSKTTTFSKITGFYLEPVNGGSINFINLNILGDVPEYFYDRDLYYRSGESIKINIFNSGLYDIRIFSGEILNSLKNFELNGLNNLLIPSSGSGFFRLINNGVVSFNNLKLILDTNYGLRELLISLSGIRLEDELYYLSLGPEVFSVDNNFYEDYNSVYRNKQSSNISIELKYISGLTGDYYKPVRHTSFVENIEVSGEIFGSGYLYGPSTGLISGYNILRDFYEYGTGSGIASKFKIADDQYIERIYNVSGSGLGEAYLKTVIPGTGFSDNIVYSGWTTFFGGTLTGRQSGLVTGLIPDERRTWIPGPDGNLQPRLPPDVSDLICKIRPQDCIDIFSGSGIKYEYASGIVNINDNITEGFTYINYQYTGKITGDYSGEDIERVTLKQFPVFVTGNFVEKYAVTGIAFAKGGIVSGKLQGDPLQFFEPGRWLFYKDWEGVVTGEIVQDWTGSGFDPINNEWIPLEVTGFWRGTIFTTGELDICDLEFPEFLPYGIPEYVNIIGQTGRYTFTITGGPITQRTRGRQYLEWPFETSLFAISSGNTQLYPWYPRGGRTRISRLGNTPSGFGKFDNVFQIPFYTGVDEQKFVTGEDGVIIKNDQNNNILAWKYVLDSTGAKIPLYSGYYCAPLKTGSNGQVITGNEETGGVVFDNNGEPIPMPLLCLGNNECLSGVCVEGICFEQLRNDLNERVFDDDGNPIPDTTKYQCLPLRDSNNNIVVKPLIDFSGSVYIKSGDPEKIIKVFEMPGYSGIGPMFLMEPDMFRSSLKFFGWEEEIPTFQDKIYPGEKASYITGFSGNCFLVNNCDTSYINFSITGTGKEKVDFVFSPREPKKIIQFQLFRNGSDSPLLFVSGGLWFYTGGQITASRICESGDYYGTLDFTPFECLTGTTSLYSCLSFSNNIFTGYEKDGFLSAKISRVGYTDNAIKTKITAYFTGPQYKYLSSGVKESGIIWDISWGAKELEKIVSFPIYPNNKKENDVFGEFHIGITDVGELPAEFFGINSQTASFIIKDYDSTGVATIQNKGQDPTIPSGSQNNYIRFGIDLDSFVPKRPSLLSWSYRCVSSSSSSSAICPGVICPPNYVIDPASCLCAPLIDSSSSSSSVLPVEVKCEGIPIIISGYAFYRDFRQNVFVPGLGNIPVGCAGGHICNRTNFLPVISFDGGLRYQSSSEISLNNLPGGGDRNATFEITVPNSLDITGKKAQFVLECKSPNNNCHEGVTFVVMTTTINSSTIKLFQQCVAPNQVTNFPILCSGFGCENNLYQDFVYFTGIVNAGTSYGNITINNPTNKDIAFIMEGSVDDDLMINGSPYDPTCCIFANGLNGAHAFSLISGLDSNGSFTVAARDNHGANASYSFRICWISGAI